MVERWPVKASRMKGPLFKITECVLFEEQQKKSRGQHGLEVVEARRWE